VLQQLSHFFWHHKFYLPVIEAGFTVKSQSDLEVVVKKLFIAIPAICLCLPALSAFADTLELKNGSLIQGTFISASAAQISFRVGPRLQHYAVAEVASVKFDPDLIGSAHYGSNPRSSGRSYTNAPSNSAAAPRTANYPQDPLPNNAAVQPPSNSYPAPQPLNNASVRPQVSTTPVGMGNEISLPAGTRLTIRMVDGVDSDRNRVGERFAAMLDQPLYVNNVLVAAKGTSVYGRFEEAKQTGQLTGKAELRLSLNGIVVNGQNYPLSTGDYELSGKSRSNNTSTRAGGGIASAGGGIGSAIAAPIPTKGDQIHVPSETLLDFALDQPVTLPIAQTR
jgi:hypothetical protein